MVGEFGLGKELRNIVICIHFSSFRSDILQNQVKWRQQLCQECFFSWVFLRDRPEFCHLRLVSSLIFCQRVSFKMVLSLKNRPNSKALTTNTHPAVILPPHTKSKRSHNGWSSLLQWSSFVVIKTDESTYVYGRKKCG